MLFNSYPFIFLFLPVVVGVCFLLAAKVGPTTAQDWLVAASLFFYGAWNVSFLPLLVGSIAFNFVAAKGMIRLGRPGRWILPVAVAADLGLLGYCKYANWFVATVDGATGAHWTLATVALPLGISFYTFQQITLLVDVSRGRIEHFRFRDFMLFVTFYPHLVAGPIVHHKEMMPQFEKATYAYDPQNLAVGATLFAAGLFKKAVIADGIAEQVAPLFHAAEAGQHLPLLSAWTAALGFTLQIYFDFSGYSEMALGLARMLGIRLPVNFNSPLKATNIIEFWSRWNMTLTRFLTTYVYSPLSLSLTRRRLGARRPGIAGVRTTPGAFLLLIALPTVTTMFLSGLWHGAGNQFLVFGLLNGAYLVICHAWRMYRPLVWPDAVRYRRVMAPIGLVLTFVGVTVSLLYFKAASVGAATSIVAGMVGAHGVVLPLGVVRQLPQLSSLLEAHGVTFEPGYFTDLVNLWIVVPLAMVLFAPNVLEVMRAYGPAIGGPAATPKPPTAAGWRPLGEVVAWQPSASWAVLTGALAAMAVLTLTKVTEFLYWQF